MSKFISNFVQGACAGVFIQIVHPDLPVVSFVIALFAFCMALTFTSRHAGLK